MFLIILCRLNLQIHHRPEIIVHVSEPVVYLLLGEAVQRVCDNSSCVWRAVLAEGERVGNEELLLGGVDEQVEQVAA